MELLAKKKLITAGGRIRVSVLQVLQLGAIVSAVLFAGMSGDVHYHFYTWQAVFLFILCRDEVGNAYYL